MLKVSNVSPQKLNRAQNPADSSIPRTFAAFSFNFPVV